MEAVLISGLVNLGYLAIGVLALWGLFVVANRTGITGESFRLHAWLDIIAGDRGAQGPDKRAMAIVIAGLLVAGSILASAFIGG
jgi:hypothetical protein